MRVIELGDGPAGPTSGTCGASGMGKAGVVISRDDRPTEPLGPSYRTTSTVKRIGP